MTIGRPKLFCRDIHSEPKAKLKYMKAISRINKTTARMIGEKLQIHLSEFDLLEFKEALNVELTEELKEGEFCPEDDLSESDLMAIGRVAWVHLYPFMD